MYYKVNYKSPLGDIILASNEENIIGLWIGQQRYIDKTMPEDMTEKDDLPILKKGIGWLDNYFAGKRPPLSGLSLSPMGTDFRQEVWKILLEIPYGQLTTYGKIGREVAKRMGRESMSAQAVGGAVGHNPISIIIPCHRVIGSDRSLTGYASGIDNKIKLLEHEDVDMSDLILPKKIGG